MRKVSVGQEQWRSEREGNCASVTKKYGTFSMQGCKDFLRFEEVCAVARADWVTVALDAVSGTEERTKKARVQIGLEKAEEDDQG